MRRGLFSIALALALVGCGGEIGELPQPLTGFDAAVNATPYKVQPGQWVRFELQMKSRFKTPVEVNLALRLVEDATNKVVFTQRWEKVHFEADEVYNITQNYLSATDTGRTAHRVELEATAVDTGEVVWTQSAATFVEFGT